MDLLPENIQALLQHPAISYIRTSTQDQLSTHLSHLRSTYVQPYIIGPLSTFLTSTSTAAMPDLISVFMLLVILFISLKILDYARRVVMFWVTLAFRFVFWGSLLGLGFYVYKVGVENAGRDLGWVWGVVMGFVEDFQARSAANAGGAGSGPGWGRDAGAGSRSGSTRGSRGAYW
ncbi:Nuclear pore assembly and biogenesis protein APQ12 [Penicillium angulare]|uniref:Nuclear pore assembly and biogenesis protein APQ12 n=1 Tax=Penicillium angulare TaxID=116970 RepID=UPI00253F7E6E|nr:Nuclear pore assembly and biogenesis protein APQ12 [Penicillium angulare]KAJ5279788.1 Nuclear pore assembly and biogenesis protein APQ12 [Penicillium angulare]